MTESSRVKDFQRVRAGRSNFDSVLEAKDSRLFSIFPCLLVLGIAFWASQAVALLTTSDTIINSSTVVAGPFAGDNFGSDVDTGDVNGDGILDLIVGSRGADAGGTDRGVVFIFFRDGAGAITGEYRISDPAGDPDDILDLGSAQFGRAVEWLGDYDGDGLGELAIGEFVRTSVGKPTRSGRIWILGLDSGGVPRKGFEIESGSTNFVALDAEDSFGVSLADLGDWDGDGAPELAVGALQDGDGGAENGAVYILYLDPSSSATAIKEFSKLSATAGGFDGAFDPPTWFGSDITVVGDLNSDGQTDLAIGAMKRTSKGAVWIVQMDPDCQLGATTCAALPGAVEITQGAGGFLGNLGNGDLFGSGLAFLPAPGPAPGRLAVGVRGSNASFTDAGAVWVLTLANDGTVVAEGRISNGENTTFSASSPVSNIGGEFGFSVAPADDLDGDGIVDLVVGATAKDDGAINAGAAYVFTLNANTGPDPMGPMGRACFVSSESGDGLVAEFVEKSSFAPGNYLDQLEAALDSQPTTTSPVSNVDFDLLANTAGSFGPFSHNGIFGVRFTGFINLREPGVYTFSSNSDDGLSVTIGNFNVIHLDAPTFFGNRTRRVEVDAAGVYPIEILFFDSAPCCNGLRLGAQGPAGSGLPPVDPNFDFDADLGPTSVGGGPGTLLIPQDLLFQSLPADCSPVVDTDFDGVPDDYDNCPDFFNPTQEDDDGDGLGDFCDNCPRVSNPGQENTGGYVDVGDVCTPALVILRRDPMSIDPEFDLELACGGLPIGELNVGLGIPFGAVAATADFGGGCDEPVVSPETGVPVGTGCTVNPDLGSVVDAANSGAYGPGLPPPFGPTAFYVQLRGNGVDGRFCDPYDPAVFLGRYTTGPAATFSGRSWLFPPLGFPSSGLSPALDTDDQPAPLGQRTSGAGDPDLELNLKPAAGEDPATATRWSLCISEFTDQRMHRISAGLRVEGATTADIRVEGCDTTPDGGGVRDCDTDMPDIAVGATVDQATSFTVGPLASPTAPEVDGTLYVVVEGSSAAPGATTLNPTQFQEWCVATIEVDAPPGAEGVPPTFVTDGLGTLPYSDAMADAWQTSTTLLVPLTLEQVALDNGFNQGDDLDGDGVLDAADNCRFIANVDPTSGEMPNNGDFLAIPDPPDDDGDACECGDANGSGAVFDDGTPDPSGSPLTPDLDVIRAYLVGNNTDPDVAAICSVSDGIACDTKDAVVLQRAFNAQGPGVQARCDAALPD